jgi:hypothetical protein
MRFGSSATMIITLFSIAGCGGAEPPSDELAVEEVPPESVFDPWVATIDRAEGVQQTVDEQAEALRRRLEEAER